MSHRTRERLRRLSVATLAGVVALSVSTVAASAQAAEPPAPAPVDDLCAGVPAGHDPFDDVLDSNTFDEHIRCMEHAQITLGVSHRVYAPFRTVDRAQMASFVVRMMQTADWLDLGTGIEPLPPHDGTNGFTDVADDDTHTAAINRLAATGVTVGGPGGLPATSYGPGLPVTREQMASFITGALEHLTGVERTATSDYFTDDASSIHQDNINAVAEVGIAVGDGSTSFGPDEPLTRGQMSAFVMRSLANLERDGVISPLPLGVPLVLASEAGVSVVTADGTTTAVSDVPAAAAYGVADHVVFQDADTSGAIYPPRGRGPVRVSSSGVVRDLPADPAAAGVYLLTAGFVDGAPTAVVAEGFGGTDPTDVVEALVLIDLTDDSRTEVVRRPAWESGHLGAGLLPDGDVIGLVSTEAFLDLIRWTPGADEPVWAVEVGQDARVELAFDGRVAVVETPWDGPDLAVTAYDPTTGEAVETTTVDIVDPGGEIDTGVLCGEWLAPYELACARSGGSPVALSLQDGTFRPLPGEPGAIPTVVRTDG